MTNLVGSYMTTRAVLFSFALNLVLCSLSSRIQAEPYGSGWYGEVQASLSREDNVSRSFHAPDEVSDEIFSVSLGGGHSQKINNTGEIVFYGYVAVNNHNEYDDLDNVALTLGGRYSHQFQPGFDSTWYIADLSATIFSYEDSEAREGTLFFADLSTNRRLGSKASWQLGYRYRDMEFPGKTSSEEERDAAFDTATHEAYLGIDYRINRSLFLYGEYALRRGNAWTNTSFKPSEIPYDGATMDRVFDECALSEPGCEPRYAGKVRSKIRSAILGIAFPLRSVNVDISGAYYRVDGDNGRKYDDWFVTAGIIWNF